jgi:hypothetical protein
MTRYHCLKCGELEAMANPFPWIPGGEARAHRPDCLGGRVIPIATPCHPPEPTVIDESDLAPGMVVVAVDENPRGGTFICTPDVVMRDVIGGVTHASRCAYFDYHVADEIRAVAGDPC